MGSGEHGPYRPDTSDDETANRRLAKKIDVSGVSWGNPRRAMDLAEPLVGLRQPGLLTR
jgi:hypothetical protein